MADTRKQKSNARLNVLIECIKTIAKLPNNHKSDDLPALNRKVEKRKRRQFNHEYATLSRPKPAGEHRDKADVGK